MSMYVENRHLAYREKLGTNCIENGWEEIAKSLDENGYAVIKNILSMDSCDNLTRNYAVESLYRATIHMARYSFGKGEYKYFSYPLPADIQTLRVTLYTKLAVIANSWNERLNIGFRFPDTHESYLQQCHGQGQKRPTPLILKYGEGDYNCLHQDLYGALSFPIQLAILLDEPGLDFQGGEFMLTEQRPRMQTKATVVPLQKGDAVIFPVNERPVRGGRGEYRVKMRHGVSKIHSGNRHTLGVIFHDAT